MVGGSNQWQHGTKEFETVHKSAYKNPIMYLKHFLIGWSRKKSGGKKRPFVECSNSPLVCNKRKKSASEAHILILPPLAMHGLHGKEVVGQ